MSAARALSFTVLLLSSFLLASTAGCQLWNPEFEGDWNDSEFNKVGAPGEPPKSQGVDSPYFTDRARELDRKMGR